MLFSVDPSDYGFVCSLFCTYYSFNDIQTQFPTCVNYVCAATLT
jgi:hypothetical protein